MSLLFQSGKSVKDKVTLTLGYVWPLKAKEILSYIKSNFNANVTYQAVYKSINELIEEGVIVKADNGFMLSKEWVGSLRDYTSYVDQSYKIGIPKKEITNSEQLTVSCIWDWYYHILVVMEKLANDEYATKAPCVFRAVHAWNGLVIGKEEFIRAVKVILKYDRVYAITNANTPLDNALAKYWENLKVNFKVNAPLVISSDVVIIGDFVIQAMYPNELINSLNKFFEEIKNVEEMDVVKFQRDIFYKKTDIPVITVKNKTLADNLRKENLEFFK